MLHDIQYDIQLQHAQPLLHDIQLQPLLHNIQLQPLLHDIQLQHAQPLLHDIQLKHAQPLLHDITEERLELIEGDLSVLVLIERLEHLLVVRIG